MRSCVPFLALPCPITPLSNPPLKLVFSSTVRTLLFTPPDAGQEKEGALLWTECGEARARGNYPVLAVGSSEGTNEGTQADPATPLQLVSLMALPTPPTWLEMAEAHFPDTRNANQLRHRWADVLKHGGRRKSGSTSRRRSAAADVDGESLSGSKRE